MLRLERWLNSTGMHWLFTTKWYFQVDIVFQPKLIVFDGLHLTSPREYHYRTLVGLFQKIVLRERTILNIPKPIAKYDLPIT